MKDQNDEERVRQLLRGSGDRRPLLPFEQLMARPRRTRKTFGTAVITTVATVVVALIAVIAGGQLAAVRQELQRPATAGTASPSAPANSRAALPQPVLQSITRMSPAAQVAWVGVYPQGQPGSFLGVDPAGKIVGRLTAGRYFRSADGATLYGFTNDAITAYSAADGRSQRTYQRNPADPVVDVSFSPDGRWLALLGAAAYVQVIDLLTGSAQITPLGFSSLTNGVYGSTLLFSGDSKRLYTIVDPAGPMSVTAFDVMPTGLVQIARAVDAQSGKTLPACQGLAPKIVDGGRTLVLFCHADGLVAFIDLATLSSTAAVHADQKNPFWLSPIFTPDGQLLYLHQLPAFGDSMQVVDLKTHLLLGPVPVPVKLEDRGPFSWLVGSAVAGGVASTVPIAPDGSKLYAATGNGVATLRIPDLKLMARLANGLNLNEVWVSGDGKTLFATDNGNGLYVVPEAGGTPIPVTLPAQIGGFIASEHG